MKKTDAQLLSVILSDIDRLILLTKDLSYSDFASSFTLSDCCCFRLIQISENVRRLSPEFFFEHPGVPLRAIIGLRNRAVHDYGHVNLQIIYRTVKEELPRLKEALVRSSTP